MRVKFKADTRKLHQRLRDVRLSEKDLRQIEFAGATQVINKQRELVPVDLGTTKNSVGQHIEEANQTRIVDEIGPETDYAVYLEYGTGEFAEGGDGRKGGWVYETPDGVFFTLGMRPRPFVRPSVKGNTSNIFSAISTAYGLTLGAKWRT